MAPARTRSLKMYLTIFVATTCIYMVLYQYHVSRQPITTQAEYVKNKANSISADVDITEMARKYNSILWSPISLFSARQPQEQQQTQQTQTQQTQSHLQQQQEEAAQQSISERQSSLNAIEERKSLTELKNSIPLSSPLQARQQQQQIQPNHLNNSNSRSSIISASTTTNSSNPSNPLNSSLITNIASTLTLPSLPDASLTTSKSTEKVKSHRIPLTSGVIENQRFITNKNGTGTTTSTTTREPTKATTTSHSMQNAGVPLCPTAETVVVKGANPLPAPPPPLYIITPTYKRAEQLAELTRLGYTLKHVPNLLWLVIEDANHTSPLVVQTLNRIAVPYQYFLAPMPDVYKRTKKPKPRGVSNRNRGLDYVRANATGGVVYFADDDNTYDISIFDQMRYTKKVSMWPVGLVTKFGVSTPIIRDGKITGFYDGWIGGRKFPVDMAGFAVSVRFLHERPAAKMPYKPGYEEDGFLRSLEPLNLSEIELLASNCTEILTWHTQTKKNANATALNMKTHGDTNLVILDKFLVRA